MTKSEMQEWNKSNNCFDKVYSMQQENQRCKKNSTSTPLSKLVNEENLYHQIIRTKNVVGLGHVLQTTNVASV